MSLDFAVQELERAVSILTTHPGRILERLMTARMEPLSHIEREDIPERWREQFDQIMKQLNALDSLDEDDGVHLATLMEDLLAVLDDELI